MKKLFVVAGEVSGDTHGSGFMQCLLSPSDSKGTPAFEISGLGGQEMTKLSEGIEDWLGDAAVLGLWEVLGTMSWILEGVFTALLAIYAWRINAQRGINDLWPYLLLLVLFFTALQLNEIFLEFSQSIIQLLQGQGFDRSESFGPLKSGNEFFGTFPLPAQADEI